MYLFGYKLELRISSKQLRKMQHGFKKELFRQDGPCYHSLSAIMTTSKSKKATLGKPKCTTPQSPPSISQSQKSHVRSELSDDEDMPADDEEVELSMIFDPDIQN